MKDDLDGKLMVEIRHKNQKHIAIPQMTMIRMKKQKTQKKKKKFGEIKYFFGPNPLTKKLKQNIIKKNQSR